MNNLEIQEFIEISKRFNHTFATRSENETDKIKFQETPHCWFLGAIMDRGLPFAKAWNIPYEIAKREFNGDVSFKYFVSLSLSDYIRIFDTRPYLHRYKLAMAECFYLAVQKIKNDYKSDISNIWKGNLSSYEVIDRLKEFKGIGDKIATMCCNILYRDLEVPFSDAKAIGVSPDVHVQRVFYRLGLADNIKEDPKIIMSAAKKLHPEYPGIFDLVCWMIGENKICANDIKKCNCHSCPLEKVCAKKI